MTDRDTGTKVHTTMTASDSTALLPLEDALGYDLAQSLFHQRRNLFLEGLTNSWYFEATAYMLRDKGIAGLNEKIALLPADTAGKVICCASILHANNLAKHSVRFEVDHKGKWNQLEERVTRAGTDRIVTINFQTRELFNLEIDARLRGMPAIR